MVATSLIDESPGTNRMGRPISVARPTASSTAASPAILRMNRCLPCLAMVIKNITMIVKNTEPISALMRMVLNHCSVARAGLDGALAAWPLLATVTTL